MDTYVLDFESFYSNDYTLSKMDPPSYILSPLFEATCLGVARNGDQPYVVDGPDIPHFFDSLPRGSAVVSHNALFDACIYSWRFNYVPRLIIDTLAMSRTLLGHKLKSHSLAKVAEHLGLPAKGQFLANVKGMTRADIKACGLWDQYVEYCLHDVDLCRSIFKILAAKLPTEEFLVHDLVARCAVEPMFCLDTNILAEHLAQVRAEKEDLYQKAVAAGLVSKDQLMSNPQFAEILRQLGVDPPLKISERTGDPTYAFSRNDIEFMELREHPDHRVQVVVEARLGHKTTLEETRTERMLNIADLNFPYHGGPNILPIPLKIGAAITHRLGGDWKLNAQNWGRQSPIRRAVRAPWGCTVVASDAAQIEARLTAWFCGQDDMVEAFAKGLDVYALFASEYYGFPVNKRDHPGPRFVGKTGVLQLGYQSGWLKFMRTVLLLSTKDGMPIELSESEAMRIVDTYRHKNSAISGRWEMLGAMINWMANADEDQTHEMGPVTFHRQRITGPNGLEIHYDGLQYFPGSREWFYDYGGRTYKLFGGKVLENIIQLLARVATMQAALRVHRRTSGILPVKFAHQAHDELVYLCPSEVAPVLAPILTEEMSRTPDWAPGLPLRGETKIGPSYGEMKEFAA